LVVKCLIRDKAPSQALRVTQFLKENCISNKGETNVMDIPDLDEDHEEILEDLEDVRDLISFDINTFFLNG
jgi:hypothetical protein